MTRQIEPIISDRDTLHLHDTPFKLHSKVDLLRFKPSFIPRPDQQQHGQTNIRRTKVDTTASWESTLERCIKSIVSIKTCRTRGLDTEIPGSFTATGFVVDPERGIILSNRHVVSISPITAVAVFCNYEEIELTPIYRDPIHDFGFFQYDPCKIRFLDIPGIELYPKGAKIGQEIRVVGNDAGEKLSILSGTLARLDREAPTYGIGEYNDFNTFYYQAASSTSSGSSGSPVLDVCGRAVALNAGGAQTSSSSYYLPLDRAQRALKLIQNGKHIPRGTIQTTFEYQPYDALLQLGLGRHIEKRLRSRSKQPDVINEGLLVVKSVLPDGPAYGYLEPGDILLTCDEQLLPLLFIDLEEHFDSAITTQSSIKMVISRAGDLKEFAIKVQDLHSITPYRYLEFGGGTLNDLSYQMARSYGLSLKNAGVYVGAAGFVLGTALALRRSIIVGINNKPVASLDDLISVVSEIAQGKRVPIRYYSLSRPMKMKVMVLHMDWRWHKFQLATRNDETGIWDYMQLKTPLNNTALYLHIDQAADKVDNENVRETPLQSLKKSIVSIDCRPPFVIDGLKNSHSYGAGIVISLDPPLALCDRDTVPVGISVISLTFENSITISADLLFLHPYYNFAILKFDPASVLKAGIEITVAHLDDTGDLEVGDSVNYIGLSGRNEIDMKKTTITILAPIRTTETTPPRWRATNVEAYKVGDGTLASQGGLFADDSGRVKAIWMSFSIDNERREQSSILGGLPTRLVLPTVNKIKAGQTPVVRGLDAEFWTMQISNARLLGVSDAWIEKVKMKTKAKSQPHILYVLGITDVSTLSGQLLKPADILLSINGEVITSISDLCRFTECEELKLTIVRDGQEQVLSLPTTAYNGKETTEVVGWQGLLIQGAYASAKEQVRKAVPEGVYVSCCHFGSPAQANLKPGIWITEVDQVPVKTLREFLEVVKIESIRQRQEDKLNIQKLSGNGGDSNVSSTTHKNEASALLALPTKEEIEEIKAFEENSHIQIKYVTASNVTHVTAIKMNLHYWPTWYITKDDKSIHGWKMTFMT